MSMFSTGRAAAYLGVNVKTLQRWDREVRSQAGALADWTPSLCVIKN
jgi:DNA-binding transcriptional regulator YiaG